MVLNILSCKHVYRGVIFVNIVFTQGTKIILFPIILLNVGKDVLLLQWIEHKTLNSPTMLTLSREVNTVDMPNITIYVTIFAAECY